VKESQDRQTVMNDTNYDLKLVNKVFTRYENLNVESNKTRTNQADEDLPTRKYDEACISIFACKCAILELLNLEIPLSKIRKILINDCRWNCYFGNVSLEEFLRLYHIITGRTMSGHNNDHLQTMYEFYDICDRGWVDKQNFSDVFKSVCPQLEKEIGNDFFSLLDLNNTNRVSLILENLSSAKFF
jgi:hypothetical protein